jgi:AraC family L-rhamnose operon transcriptional activator RhaR/AraC family L-rhamnose operon regulatory protein RhaS
MLRTLKNSDWFPSDGFPITVERRDPQESFPPHRHEFSEIVLITGGKGLHVVGRESWALAAGDVFVIGGPRAHEYRDRHGLRLINILFQPERLQMDLGDLTLLPGYHALFSLEPAWRARHGFGSRLRLPPRDLATVLGLVDRMEAELTERAGGFRFLATALFMQIVGLLARCYTQARDADSRHLLKIAQAITHLESCTQNTVNLEELAAIAGMSKRSLVRAFHDATGVPPITYLIQLRINRAAAMLRSCTDSVTDIAFRVGFNDSNYFTRQFSRQMGLSPRRYRQLHTRPVVPNKS